ncbi:unnamed protein product [Miscanthus lutarioriparius]|uniref:indole-3-pyruvate monooxygenase n=1 Tax=Miscanthus lutarioriparius TaxID=422564 RepID=A0A811PFT5_9POAL|nr:unnamed protein product [Miscanthus lutarioriparius]
MDCIAETEGKMAHDPLTYCLSFTEETEGKMEQDPLMYSPRSAVRTTTTGIPVGDQAGAMLPGTLIVGAGPAGLACVAGLTMGSVPYTLMERDVCIASMWHHRMYRSYPMYPTQQQFLAYIDKYMRTFSICPFFRQECRSKWLIVATRENAEPVVPEIEGIHSFTGQVMHSSEYHSGEASQGKKVLVIGRGNSGMEVSLDLANQNVHTSMVVRELGHILPREIMGLSTFTLSL